MHRPVPPSRWSRATVLVARVVVVVLAATTAMTVAGPALVGAAPDGPVAAAVVEPAIVPVTTGDDHSCGLRSDGAAFCWGIDNYGQLGNGPELTGNQQSPTAVDVSALPEGTTFVALSAADRQTCGLSAEGDIYCWGQRLVAPFGTIDELSAAPLDLTGLPEGITFASVAVGEGHACAISTAGGAYCWGNGNPGQLGVGAEATLAVPTPVDQSALPEGTTWTSISTGSIHSCGVTAAGAAYCWGNNNHGRLGLGTTDGNVLSPMPVDTTNLPPGTTWTSVKAGDNHTCGVTTTGAGFCWGRDNLGQLGNGTLASGNMNPRPLPLDLAALPAGTTWDSIAAGDELSCGITAAGALACWGTGAEVPNGTSPQLLTAGVPAGTTWTSVSVASSGTHVCARTGEDATYCFGWDSFGQLGNGPDTQATPSLVAYPAIEEPEPPLAAAPIAAGEEHACGLDADGAPFCWGRDNVGQLGNGAAVTANQNTPYPVDLSGLPEGTAFVGVTVGSTHSCGLTEAGTGYCWGADTNGRLGNGPDLVGNQVAPTPIDMAGLPAGTAWASLEAGYNRTCGITTEDVAYCWGNGSNGEIGHGASESPVSPVAVQTSGLPAGTTFTQLTSGTTQTCGVTDAGSIYCWGRANANLLGYVAPAGTSVVPAPTTPVDVSALPAGTTFAQVVAGGSHTCALTTDGLVYCWGQDINGQLGNGAINGDKATPSAAVLTNLPAGAVPTSLDAGANQTCLLTDAGAVYCWGFGGWGALGDGTTNGRALPTSIATAGLPAGIVFTHVSTLGNLTCAASEDDGYWCWGRDNQGQQGNGPTLTADPSLSPTLVAPMVEVVGLPPTITIDQPTVVGSIGDPTNPTATITLADPDTDLADLTVTAAPALPGVIPASGVTVTGTGAERVVGFAPTGRGVTNISLVVTDPDGNGSSVTLAYGASAQAPDPTGRYHHHISDASTAIDVGDGYMLLANDETNTLFLHRQGQSGPPVKTFTFDHNQLGTSAEIDLEAAARSGNTIIWVASHGNNRSGSVRTERRTMFATTISGSGASTELTFAGRYDSMWAQLIAWDRADGHGLGADALGFHAASQPGVLPNAPDGFNVEGLEFAPDGTTGYLGFRAPTVEVGGEELAVVVPVTNLLALNTGTPGTTPAIFGEPVLLDLGGRSIRDIRKNADDEYLISAGSSPDENSWALYTWDGDPEHDAELNRLLPTEDLETGGTWESIVSVPHPLEAGAQVRLVTDSGDSDLYGTGATKDIAQGYQKSYSQLFTLNDVPVDVEPGRLRVTTSPALPADIIVDGVERDTWGLNWVQLPAGPHEVCFGPVTGWGAPACETIEVVDGETTTVSGEYTQQGWLRVTTNPAVASTISVDGVAFNEAAVDTQIVAGAHEVCFGAVAGFTPPPCQTVTVTAGLRETIAGTFTATPGAPGPAGPFGYLRVTTNPAAGATIIVDDVARDSWGLNWLKVAPGAHEVCFGAIPDATAPACETVTVTAGATSTVQGTYVVHGFIQVATDPALDVSVLIDGEVANAYGAWRSAEPGPHEVCFGDIDGWVTPDCQTVTVTVGTSVTATGTYTTET